MLLFSYVILMQTFATVAMLLKGFKIIDLSYY